MPKARTNTKIKDLKKTIIEKQGDAPDDVKVLFDRNAQQKVYLSFPYKGRKVEVAHTLNFPSDERIIEYYKKRTVEEKVSAAGIESSDEISGEAVKLWDELAVSREGYAQNDRADWKEKTSITHKENAVDGLLSVIGMFPEILDSEFIGVEDDEQTIIRIKSLFNAEYIFTEIIFNQPNAEQMRRYKKIRDSNVRREENAVIETTSLNLADRAKLFDELVFDSVGYKNGVPINHKAVAAMVLFENQIEV
ncbi:MAG TPA: hypothetical protein VK308_12425, partial [Pyrinomonadaceae bacterium]|nr:hypothetical protein [Pyrinomonadaceae bacterium]